MIARHFLSLIMSVSPNGDQKPLLNNIVVANDYPELPKVSSPTGNGSGSPLPSSAGDKFHMDEIIPSKHSNRTIILCFDGTGDQFDEDVRIIFSVKRNILSLPYSKNSNIVQFFSMLRKDNKSEQMVYYQVCQLI